MLGEADRLRGGRVILVERAAFLEPVLLLVVLTAAPFSRRSRTAVHRR